MGRVLVMFLLQLSNVINNDIGCEADKVKVKLRKEFPMCRSFYCYIQQT